MAEMVEIIARGAAPASAMPRPHRRGDAIPDEIRLSCCPRSAPRAALNVGTSAKYHKGIFAPRLIIPAAYFVRLSFGRAQSRHCFALDRVHIMHGLTGAFHQRLRG